MKITYCLGYDLERDQVRHCDTLQFAKTTKTAFKYLNGVPEMCCLELIPITIH